MTRGIIIASAAFGMALGTGCATQRPPVVTQAAVAPVLYEDVEAEPASALIFQSSVASAGRPVDLSRAAREPSAFVSFDGPITTFLFEQTDDRQTNDGGDHYDRRTMMFRLGTSTR